MKLDSRSRGFILECLNVEMVNLPRVSDVAKIRWRLLLLG
jgi:hypothetical protein